jgi:hypothetical protein
VRDDRRVRRRRRLERRGREQKEQAVCRDVEYHAVMLPQLAWSATAEVAASLFRIETNRDSLTLLSANPTEEDR